MGTLNSEPSRITQAEIDAVGFFVEAARDLAKSRFLHEDHRQQTLTGSMSGGNGYLFSGERTHWTGAALADSNVLQAAITPFRRMWMNREPCYGPKVMDILLLRVNDQLTRSVVAMCRHELTDPDPCTGLVDLGVTAHDLIDLIINARYAHAGPDGGPARDRKRSELTVLETRFGKASVAWAFETALFYVGITYVGFLDVAASALRAWESRCAVKPSFAASVAELITGSDASVTRRTPGMTRDAETEFERVGRLLRRERYKGLQQFFFVLGLTEASAVQLIQVSTLDVPGVVRESGLTLSLRDEYEQATDPIRCSTAFDYATSRSGMMECSMRGEVVLTGRAPEILTEQLSHLRQIVAGEIEDVDQVRVHARQRFEWSDVRLER